MKKTITILLVCICLMMTGCGADNLDVDGVKNVLTDYSQVVLDDGIIAIDISKDGEKDDFDSKIHTTIRDTLHKISKLKITKDSPKTIIISMDNKRGVGVFAYVDTDIISTVEWNKITDKIELENYITIKYFDYSK